MNLVSQKTNTRYFGKHKEALDLLQQGSVRESILILADLAEEHPVNHYICHDLGKAVLAAGMLDQAVIAFRQAIELDDTDHESLLMLAKALDLKGEYQDAIVALCRAIDLLTNPGRGENEKMNDPAVVPLAFADSCAIFSDFKLKGDVNSLFLESETQDKEHRHFIQICISGDTPFASKDGYEEIESALLERGRLLPHLSESLTTTVGIFPAESFPYKLMQKIESDD